MLVCESVIVCCKTREKSEKAKVENEGTHIRHRLVGWVLSLVCYSLDAMQVIHTYKSTMKTDARTEGLLAQKIIN